MRGTISNQAIANTMQRSVSNGYYFPSSQIGYTYTPTYAPDNKKVHLITSDLWEAITGEKLSPSIICQILDKSIPMSDNQNSQIAQMAMQYVLMSQDRQGSRVLQKRIEEGNRNERSLIFNSLYPNLNQLVYDTSGNFVIQKLCEYLTEDQQKYMLNFFLRNIQKVIDHQNGCRVLQKFIEHTSTANIGMIFNSVKPFLLSLCFSQNGNHIVQRFIDSLPNRIPEIIECIEPRLLDLILDNCGCRVVQKLFERCPIEQLEPIVQTVLTCPVMLAMNQYGNYVVQNILESGKREYVSALIKAFKGHFYEFSMHKFASNVIEKCIRGATKDEQYQIFEEVIGDENNLDEERILRLINDQSGNYVIQRIIEYGSESQKNIICDVVYRNYDELDGGYARHVIAKLEKFGF
ncbi:Pumilio-family RNA binding repeat containing protein [Histomonas meleagridis]|uniref:Pumilio-family RNA binding repeat containing protein n=1 Tax=Histomonas meleagridis TaxID=135588 RepID=UPI00355A8FAD|nr:Pumilio-family RNA binding repeat containing protein [Histomonas meleagridis]KAH0798186.1 Pumilio-family RNA binding repeat containing protein [Histomonas meleagridis]